ncbi:MAG: SDR family oxidoreductase [Pseudomonadota bacterium]
MSRPVAFITGASRGIGAESAVALAQAGYDLALSARTLNAGDAQQYFDQTQALPGSLTATAAAVEAAGGNALCLQADLLESASMVAAADTALSHYGRIDLVFNNAVYQGSGNQEAILEVQPEQLTAIYQANVITPLLLVKALLPAMLEAGSGTIINMVSHAAFHNPPAPASAGGWSFAYPSSKAALSRMVGALKAEHRDTDLRCFNLEPGFVITEVMKAAGITDKIAEKFKPCSPAAIAAVVAWLAGNDPPEDWGMDELVRGPLAAKHLALLKTPSYLPSGD